LKCSYFIPPPDENKNILNTHKYPYFINFAIAGLKRGNHEEIQAITSIDCY